MPLVRLHLPLYVLLYRNVCKYKNTGENGNLSSGFVFEEMFCNTASHKIAASPRFHHSYLQILQNFFRCSHIL